MSTVYTACVYMCVCVMVMGDLSHRCIRAITHSCAMLHLLPASNSLSQTHAHTYTHHLGGRGENG